MTHEQPEALRLAEEISDLQCSTEDAAKKIAAAADELLRLHAENEALRKDASCFRFWVREAAVNPGDMAKLIMKCTTEQEYRDAIEPLATAADDVIRSAMQSRK